MTPIPPRLQDLSPQEIEEIQSILRAWRQKVLDQLMRPMLVFVALALLASVAQRLPTPQWEPLILYAGVFLSLTALAFGRGLPFWFRGGSFLLLLYVTGLVSLFEAGPAAGSSWLAMLALAVLTLVLFDSGAAARMIGLAGFTWLSVGALFSFFNAPTPPTSELTRFASWVIGAAQIVVCIVGLSRPYQHFLETQFYALAIAEQKAALQKAHQALADQATELAHTNQRLQQEITERQRAEEALRRQNAYLAMLHDTTLGLMRRLNLSDLLEAIVKRAGQLLDTPHGYIYLSSARGDLLELHVGSGAFQDDQPMQPGEGLAGKVWVTGQPLVVADYDAWEGRSPNFAYGLIHAVAGMPLTHAAGAHTVGVLGMAYSVESNRAFSSNEVELLNRFAQLASVTIENARLFQAEAEARHTADTLREIGQVVSSTLNLDEVLERILASLNEVLKYDSGLIMLLKDGVLYIQAGRGFAEPAEVLGARLPLADYPFIQEVVETAHPIVLADVRTDPRWHGDQLPSSHPTRAWMGIPLIAAGEVIGMLAVDSYQPGAYGPADLPLALAFASQAAMALHHAELFQESQAARAEAETANAMKSKFLANMSHELRTPLNSIINFAYLLTLGTEGEVTPGQEDLLGRIGEAGRHLLGLINDILDLAKIEAGRLELFLEDIDLRELIHGVLSTAIGLLRDKPVELRHELPTELPFARADSTRVRQVLLNLLSNAAKFTQRGSITVRATLAVANGESGAQIVTISVQDTGAGIAPDDIPKVFMEFVQLDNPLTRQAGGTGLGLPISKRFVEMHGGRMWAESEVGVGTTFFFTLPCVALEKTRLVEKLSTLTEARVLVIDDDEGVRDTIAHQLERSYQVSKLNDSQRAVEQARAQRPDVIVLDMVMPGQDGWEVLKALKADPETRDIPVVMCSVSRESNVALSLAANDYLVKPVEREELRRAIGRFAPLGGRVLAVDDDPNALEIVSRLLGGLSYEVSTARDGRAGLTAAWEQHPDVIVLDLMMPELSGFDVLTQLRADPRTAETPVVVVTAKDLTPDEYVRLQSEAAALLQKGQFTADELIHTVRRAAQRPNH